MVEQATHRNCGPWRGARAEAGFLVGAVALGGPTLEQSVPEGLQHMLDLKKSVKRKEWQRGTVMKRFCVSQSTWGAYATYLMKSSVFLH